MEINSKQEIHPKAFRVNDFSRVIGLSRTTIYQLVKEGKLQCVRIAGRTLIPATEVDRLLLEAGQ